MYSRQIEQLARQRAGELRAANRTRGRQDGETPRKPAPIRTQTGWALVSLGLRLAQSGSR